MFVLPVSSPTADKGKEVDALSLDDSSLKMALQSALAAAVELDSFLAETSTHSCGQIGVDNGSDDNSFASEEQRLRASEGLLERALCLAEEISGPSEQNNVDDDSSSLTSEDSRLQASEVILRRALECIDYKDEIESLRSSGRPRESCTESFDSPENQVPLLQPLSPFGSPITECSSTEFRKETPVTPVQYLISVSSLKTEKRRQIRAYGLRPHSPVEESFGDLEAPTKSRTDMVRTMANVFFGRCEYSLPPVLSKRQYKRTVQGTASVLLASGIVVADLTKDSPHFPVFTWLLPALIAFIQANLPHRTDESVLAMLLLGTHAGLSHLYAR
jgi:hypothetical protein